MATENDRVGLSPELFERLLQRLYAQKRRQIGLYSTTIDPCHRAKNLYAK